MLVYFLWPIYVYKQIKNKTIAKDFKQFSQIFTNLTHYSTCEKETNSNLQ